MCVFTVSLMMTLGEVEKLARPLNTEDMSVRKSAVWRNVSLEDRIANEDTAALMLVNVSSDI